MAVFENFGYTTPIVDRYATTLFSCFVVCRWAKATMCYNSLQYTLRYFRNNAVSSLPLKNVQQLPRVMQHRLKFNKVNMHVSVSLANYILALTFQRLPALNLKQ